MTNKPVMISPFSRRVLLGAAVALVIIFVPQAWAQIVRETVFFDVPAGIAMNPNPSPSAQLIAVPNYPADASRMTLIALLYHPDPAVHGSGPYPAVIVLHGSGGMWNSDTIANGPTVHFEKWGQLLAARGYLAVIPDGFNPRGIPGGFANRRPHHDSAIDDAACSPNYERPKDVVAALTFLDARADVDREHIGIVGFSHGAQTGLNAILDPSVDLGNYTVDYTDANNNTVDLAVPDPIRIPAALPFPKVCVFYYPGCGHFSYHGSPNSLAAGRYMPDRRTQVLMFHGTSDSLMGVGNGNLFPIKFVLAAGAQAATLGIPNPFVYHHIYDLVGHSFDETTIVPQIDWNTGNESANAKANRLSQPETLKWLEYRLHEHTLTPQPDVNNPGAHIVSWLGRDQLRYQVETSITLTSWDPQGVLTTGANAVLNAQVVLPVEQRVFYRLEVDPVPPPVNDVANVAFYREYADFGY